MGTYFFLLTLKKKDNFTLSSDFFPMQLPTVLFAIPRYFGIPTAKNENKKNGAKRKKCGGKISWNDKNNGNRKK
jgi:hypothetical protein